MASLAILADSTQEGVSDMVQPVKADLLLP